MTSLDMKTAMAICILINIMSLAIITSLWYQNRKYFAGISFWVIDHALQLLATVLIILRGTVPDFVSMVLSNTAIVAGLLFLYIGLQRFVEKKGLQIQNYILLAIFIIIHSYYTIIQPSLDIRTINTSVTMIILCVQCIWLLMRKANPEIRRVTQGVSIAIGYIGLVSLIRVFLLIIFPESSNDFFEIPLIDSLSLVTLYLLSFVFLPFALIMMVSGRLVIIANRNERHYRQLFELESDAIILFDEESERVLDANQAVERIYGYTHDEILTLCKYDIFVETQLSPKDIEQDLQYIPTQYHRKKDGTIFPVEITISYIEFHGRIAQIFAIRDITMRMQAEEQYRNIVETANEGICVMDKGFRLTFVNQKVIDTMGYSMEEMIGRLVSDFMPQDDIQDHQAQTELRKQGEGTLYERRLHCKDGSEIVASVSSKPIFDGLGRFNGSFAMLTDITEHKHAEDALNNQYAILKSIIDSPNTPVFSVDSDYCYTSFNASHAEAMKLIYGVDIQIDKNILDYMSVEEDRKIAKANFNRVLNGEQFTAESYSGEDSLSRLYFEISHNPVKNSEGKIIGVSVFVKDMTERKMAEEKLHENEERYRNVIAQAGGVAYQRDWQNEIYTFMDEGIEKLIGYSSDEMTPELFSSIVDRENPDGTNKEFLRSEISQWIIEDSPTLYKSEFRIKTKDNQTKYVSDSSVKFHNANGEVIQSLGMLQDITQHKQYEQEIINIARFPSENPNPILRISADGNIIYGNAVSKSLQDIWNGNCNSSDLPKWKEAFDKTLDTGKAGSIEINCDDKIFSLTLVPIIGRGYVNVYVLDITDRKKAEELLKQKMEELARSNVELQQFAYVSSHDLQEPLRKIQAFGDQLKTKYKEVLDERGLDYLNRMQNAAERMQTLINDLLEYSRITTKAQPFVPVNLTEVLNDVVSDLEIRIKQTGSHVEIGDMPIIDAEQSQMYQLFQNLINNGLKFHRSDVPPIVKLYSEIQNNICRIFVEDNGIGFDEQYLDRIFIIFQRLHGRLEYEGTGIGLAICRKIVDRHGGSITAKSKLGEGSTFIVTLPVKHF